MRTILDRLEPAEAYFVLEGKPKKRLSAAADYKAGRVREKDPGFRLQRKIILDLMKEWPGMAVVRHPDHECDDVIGALASLNSAVGHHVNIVSSDTDFYQAINERVTIFNPIKKKFVNPKVDPKSYVRWKALKGDSSDNIEGFRGIGDVRATKMVSDSDLLDKFLSEGANKQKFEHNVEMIRFEAVDLKSCELTTKPNDTNTISSFRDKLHELGFWSITGDKAWHKFSNPLTQIHTRFNMQKVSENDLRTLREAGLIKADETAYVVDGVVIAESLTTGDKRHVEATGLMLESKRSLLKG
jgi:5'-3' exonuclease